MKWQWHIRDVTRSTNEDAHAGAPGDVFVAHMQTAGRGRLNHTWQAAQGLNALFSAVVDVSERAATEVAVLPLVAGYAVAHALQQQLPRVKIKWPNDILIEGRKLAGILCERTSDKVIIGIGINVLQREFAPELVSRATSLALEGVNTQVDEVIGLVLDSLGACYEEWSQEGFAPIHTRIANEFDCLWGKVISVRRTDDDAQPVHGVCGGIMADGALEVGGEKIYAGEAHVII